MLYPAQLYREELKRKLVACWYNPKYDWYFNGEYSEFAVPDTTVWRRDFVHLNKDGEVDGYFSYHMNEVAKSASQFGLVSFSDNGAGFVKDCIDHMKQLIAEGLHRVEWWAVSDNPVNKFYESIIKRYDGTIAGLMHDCNYFRGEYHDSVMYEIVFGVKSNSKKGEWTYNSEFGDMAHMCVASAAKALRWNLSTVRTADRITGRNDNG